ncbi:MAG: hypothetical protein ACFFC1_13790 [Promethearchaeota archaeon]
MKGIVWSIKDIVLLLKGRQDNEFDGNIAVSGDRGNGKSTCIGKIYYRFPKFNPWKHQVYQSDHIVELLKYQLKGLCWDDEAINSGYKRDFQTTAQKEQIKVLTNYRDNFNIFASAIPNFFSLDKDLRDLYFLHLHVIERGVAVVHMPLQGRLYSQDRWDAKYNAKVEEKWSKKMQKDPKFKPPYHRLTTFRGYLFFGDLTAKQKALYKEIKKNKRGDRFENQEEEKISWIQKIYNAVLKGHLTKEGLLQACLMEGKKYSRIVSTLNGMLKDNGETETLSYYLSVREQKPIHSKTSDQISSIVPALPL